MSILKSNLTRRDLLLASASVAAVATAGANVKAGGPAGSPDKKFSVAIQPSKGHRVQPHIFGGDMEPVARVIYGGIWDRERNIPRADVKAAIGSLGITAIRWPGSSSASAYHWRDGVGPVNKRPTHDVTFWTEYGEMMAGGITDPVERATWAKRVGTEDPNQFGTDEMLQYCLDINAEPVLSVNVGGRNTRSTGTPEEAAAWVRYCNVERKSPRPVQWWQIGNEVWSKGDRDHQPPKDYGHRVVELAAAMRREDPSIKLICVATAVHPEDFGREKAAVAFPDLDIWNREVFAITAPHVNAASFTWYFPGGLGRLLRATEADAVQMATASDLFGAELDRVIADLDAVGGSHIPINVGEWARQVRFPEMIHGDSQMLYDGVFYAGCFNRMIERASRMAGAHLTFLANTIGPIQTEGDRHFVAASYLVMQLYRWTCRDKLAPVKVKTDTMLVRPFVDAEHAGFLINGARSDRQAAVLDATATVDGSGTTVYLSNRGMADPITVEVTGITPRDASARFRYVTADSPYASNTLDAPNALRIAEMPVTIKAGRAELSIPPCTAGALIVGPLMVGFATA